MDLLGIGEKFGSMMFALFAGENEVNPAFETSKQIVAAQSIVRASRKIRRKRLRARQPIARHQVRSSDASCIWNAEGTEKDTNTRNLDKIFSKRFGPRRNKQGYNYGAQLCFMKDEAFVRHVGVSRRTFDDLLRRITELQKSSVMRRSHEVSLRIRLLMTIIYLTSKKVYKDIHELFGYSEAAICRLVYKTINEINLLSSNAIKWPCDLEATSSNFFRVANFPGVIGSIDAIHLVARAPEKLHDEYRNAKGKYTIILLAVCDASRKFTYVSVGYPGSYCDSKCLDSTDLGTNLDNIPNDYFPLKKYHLVAGENFNLKEGLLVPYKTHEILSEDQVEFNKRLLTTQVITSSTFVEMKSRFQTLTKLDMNIERVVEFTTACCILHNVCLDNSDPWTGELVTEDDSPNFSADSPLHEQVLLSTAAIAKRDLIKDQIFMGLNYG